MINKILKLSKSKGLAQSLITVVGNMGSMTISAASMILISRVLGPEKFGTFSVGFAIIIILSKINDLGLTLALMKFIPRSKTENEKNKMFSFSLKIKTIFAITIAVIGIVITPYLANRLNFPSPTILYMSFIFNIFAVLYEHLLAMLQSLHKFVQAVIASSIQAIAKLISAIFLAFVIPTNHLFAFASYMSAPAISLFFAKKLLPKNTKINFSQNFSKERGKLFKMAGHSAVGFISLGIIDNIDILFVQRHLTPFETGLMGGASRIAMLFSLMAYSLSAVLNSRVAKYQNKEDIVSFIKKSLLLSIIVIFSFLLMLPFTKFAIILTIGKQYLASLSILNILLGASFITIVTTPFAAIFFSFKKAEWYFSAGGILQLLIVVFGNGIFVPELGLTAAAWTRVVAKLSLLIFTLIVASYYMYTEHFKEKVKT